MAKMIVDSSTLYHRITLTITTPPLTRLRMRVGMWFMKMGVLLSGFGGVRVVETADPDEVEPCASR